MNTKNERVSASKFLGLILRHAPETIGLTLSEGGWVDVRELLEKSAAARRPLSRELLDEVVETSDKQRFSLSEDGSRIRANQGHSVEVDLGLQAAEPPAVLFHGTATRFLDAIMAHGLNKQKRHHVHLTDKLEVARTVGSRYGTPVILRIDAAQMRLEGLVFYRSENGVWLVDFVEPKFLGKTTD